MMTDLLLHQTRRLLKQFDIRARKRLGQHFLVDTSALELIVSTAALQPDDLVVEVGPGLGVVTRELAKRAGAVVAIELDDNLAARLQDTLSPFRNVTVINNDVLQTRPEALLQGHGASDYKVVANLPYYITAPVLRHFLEAPLRPRLMVIMVQREVAETIAARPGKMSLLAVSVQFFGKPSIVAAVPAQSFYPAPRVDSAIVRIERRDKPLLPEPAGFFRLVRAGFSAPRKQLANSLAQGLGVPRPEVLPLLAQAGIMPERRAETLSLEEWAGLFRNYQEARDADRSGTGQD